LALNLTARPWGGQILTREIPNNTKVEYVAAEQKFSDLTNRVEMLETELIAMKLCKLKMEADKTEAELQVKEMEKTLHAIQNGHSSQVEHPHTYVLILQDEHGVALVAVIWIK